jgi:ORF6N domain
MPKSTQRGARSSKVRGKAVPSPAPSKGQEGEEPQVALVPVERVERSILLIRGEKVILDADLADLYGVTTKRLNEQVRRNPDRFPRDFMFQLTPEELAILRSQFATSRSGWGGRRYPPFAFTEHGAIMAANVLSSPRAIAASVMVVRAFVNLRQMLASHGELGRRLDDLEKRYDGQFRQIFAAIRALMQPPKPEEPSSGRKSIGFRPG